MSSYYDEYPEVSTITQRKARKEHVCGACGELITPGITYTYAKWLFEGEWNESKRCGRCDAIYDHLADRARLEGEDWPDWELACGHSYQEIWEEDPPEEIANLAFLTPEQYHQLQTT